MAPPRLVFSILATVWIEAAVDVGEGGEREIGKGEGLASAGLFYLESDAVIAQTILQGYCSPA